MIEALHHHHEAEDELLWPIMRQRVLTADSEIVLRMEGRHERLEKLLTQVGELNRRWRVNASGQLRDELADVLAQTSAVLDEHLSDEERDLLPLVPGTVSVQEWTALNERARGKVTNLKQALVMLGLGLEDATPDERQRIMAELPPPARLLWKAFGPRTFAKARDRIRQG